MIGRAILTADGESRAGFADAIAARGVAVRDAALEYEGDGHLTDRTTWLDDIERRELMEAAGWRVVRVISRDIFEYPELFVVRVRCILQSRTPR